MARSKDVFTIKQYTTDNEQVSQNLVFALSTDGRFDLLQGKCVVSASHAGSDFTITSSVATDLPYPRHFQASLFPTGSANPNLFYGMDVLLSKFESSASGSLVVMKITSCSTGLSTAATNPPASCSLFVNIGYK